mmetsp:Transcript_31590/g.76569  ORF Transcript_31590/g.76569 Transcript_31590/m.76569 type:complete len:1004 (-) Transcript_31590:607-3618(-)
MTSTSSASGAVRGGGSDGDASGGVDGPSSSTTMSGVEGYGSMATNTTTTKSDQQQHHHHSNTIDRVVSSDDDDDDEDEEDYLLRKERMLARSIASFDLPYSEERGFRALSYDLSSFQRPYMRAMYFSCLCFFCSYAVQYCIPPLLPHLQSSLHLSKRDVWSTNVWMAVGGVPMRFVLGPACDKYGPRLVIVAMLVLCAVPCALSGLIIHDVWTLTVMRTIIGAADAFVPSQCWITSHFVREVSGTLMSIVAGIGCTGSAFVQLAVGFLFVGFKDLTNDDAELSWKLTLVVPAAVALVVAWFAYYYTDDCPLGNTEDVKKAGLMIERSAVDSFRKSTLNLNSWLLFLQYAGTCGVDVTFCNGCAIYYHTRFNLNVRETGIICFLYGFSALYARAVGGVLSDKIGDKYSIEGRLWVHFFCMIAQGTVNVWFARTDTISQSVALMILLSILIQMSTGFLFGIIPYVDSANTSSVAGIVGGGGNAGAIILGFLFMYHDYPQAMEYMAYFSIATAFLTPLIVIRGYKGMIFGKNNLDDASRRQYSPLIVPKMQHSPHFVKLKQKRRDDLRFGQNPGSRLIPYSQKHNSSKKSSSGRSNFGSSASGHPIYAMIFVLGVTNLLDVASAFVPSMNNQHKTSIRPVHTFARITLENAGSSNNNYDDSSMSSESRVDRAQRIMYNQLVRKREETRYQIIAAEACEALATRMANEYPDRFTFHKTMWRKFPDETDNIEIGGFSTPHNVISGQHVLFLASFHNNDVTLSQFQVMICLLQSFIESMTVVLPFSPVGTMERVTREGQVATAATYAHMFSSLPNCGRPTRLMVYDLHTLQNRFYLHGNAVASLQTAIPLLKGKIHEEGINCCAFPDDGSFKRFSSMFDDMPDLEIIVCGKTRGEGDERTVTIQSGNATDRKIVIVDDLVQTGGTLYETGKVLKDAGAQSVNAFVTHGVFPNESWKRFNKGGDRCCFDSFWVTNSIPTVTDKLPVEDGIFEVLDLMPQIICDLDHYSCT